MHCSSSEPLLDLLVDGELRAHERARVEAHLEHCASCTELLDEIRAIDGLLVTPQAAELPPNFTFKVMAEVRSVSRPHAHRTPIVRIVLAYLVVSWLAIGGYFLAGHGAAGAALAVAVATFRHADEVVSAVGLSISRLCDHDPLGVGVTMGAILALDALVACAAVAAYGASMTRGARVRVASREGLDA